MENILTKNNGDNMPLNIINIKNIKSTNIIKKINSFFNKKISLPKLLKDTFSKETKVPPNNVIHKGDEFSHHVPEFITQDGDTSGTIIREMVFSKKDTEIMNKMPLDEMIQYKRKKE